MGDQKTHLIKPLTLTRPTHSNLFLRALQRPRKLAQLRMECLDLGGLFVDDVAEGSDQDAFFAALG